LSLRDRIETIAKQSGLHRIGVAPIDRFEGAPEGLSPLQLLPTARSVISLGIKLLKGVVEANRQAYRANYRPALYPYMVYGYPHPNLILEHGAYMVAQALEEEGFLGIPLPAARPADSANLRAALSHRHAAVAAGLADFGWCGLAVTRETGPKMRFISIVTDAPLPPDPLIKGRICDHARCGYACVKACPLKAIDSNDVVSFIIAGKEVSYFRLKKWSCILGSYGMKGKAMGIIDFQEPENPDMQSFLQATSQAVKEGKESERMGSCGRCFVSCPLGTTG
jgi:epoxyqueuosine reductase